ncbi:MAG TPA: hypothetical protein VNK51_25400 [Bradyrhizobium sp.]|nr:hypothetical protein [Bradyrhizobium sp.]
MDHKSNLARWLRRLSVVAAAAILGASQAASAGAPVPEIKEQCAAEIRSFCLRPWRLTPDAIMECAQENRAKLSPACIGFLETAQMCQLEMKNVCGGLFPLTIKRCLANSADKFSERCRETLEIK